MEDKGRDQSRGKVGAALKGGAPEFCLHVQKTVECVPGHEQ